MPVGLWSQIRPKGAGSVGKVSVKIAVQIQIISRGQNCASVRVTPRGLEDNFPRHLSRSSLRHQHHIQGLRIQVIDPTQHAARG